MGQQAQLINNVNAYVVDLKNELSSMKKIRFFSIVISVAFLAFTSFLLFHSLFNSDAFSILNGPYYKTAVFVSSMAAAVLIVSLLLKGAFRLVQERNADELMPPAIRQMLEAIKLLK